MILAINSSTAQYSIALITGDGIIAAEYMVIPKGNTFTGFIPAIDMLLSSTGYDPSSLKAVATAKGPGSFTGLRVGLSAAKGIAYSRNIPLIAISSLDAIASPLSFTGMPVCAMIASRRDEVFYALYNKDGDDLVRKSDIVSKRISEIGTMINEPTVVVGNDYMKQKGRAMDSDNSMITFAGEVHWNLRASSVGLLALTRFRNNDFDNLTDVVPDYIAAPDIRLPG
ncbi:MAG: tRNA (adenosine(37)-N6)-threonylcarbamoyltransferase complex dimerization subunit type 1 TsaB [Deltaproteobacteria bacterium]|nr:tRNA (adenosine(37)-N6)-threonylcarbamoyltransferase complex dimerization subunit type 1 TsaB [Deltaproteobacteria bacterium]